MMTKHLAETISTIDHSHQASTTQLYTMLAMKAYVNLSSYPHDFLLVASPNFDKERTNVMSVINLLLLISY